MKIREKIAETKDRIESTIKQSHQIAVFALCVAVIALLIAFGRSSRAV